MTSTASSPPCFAAPYQPRFDYSMIYEAYGSSYSGFFSTLLGSGNPYRFTRYSPMRCVMQRLLEGSEPVKRLFKNDPFPDAPPVEIRASLMLFTPANDGQWWVRRHCGTHLAPVRLQKDFWEHLFPHPETFHLDEILWRRRAWAPLDLVPDIEMFWQDFVPTVRDFDHKNWEGLRSFIAQLRERYGEERFLQFERIMGRLSTELSEKSAATPSLSHFQRALAAYWIIGEGRETFEKAVEDPSYLPAVSARVTSEDGLFYIALFWYDMLEFHARKIRLLEKLAQQPSAPPPRGLPGFVHLIPFLAEHFKIPGEERVPKFTRVSSGHWHMSD